jgi:hypothetical protein
LFAPGRAVADDPTAKPADPLIQQAPQGSSRSSAADPAGKTLPVEFDAATTFACKDVTPPGYGETNDGARVLSLSMRLSANVHGDPKTIAQLTYKITIPRELDIADYLPKTTLSSDFASIEREMQQVTSSGKVLVLEGGGKVSFGLPAGIGVGLNASASQKSEETEVGTARVHVGLAPPKESILTAGTENRGRVLYFKLQSSTQATLAGEKQFALLLVSPKDWHGDIMDISCSGTPIDGVSEILQDLKVGVYVQGDRDARKRQEKAAVAFESKPRLVARCPQPIVATKVSEESAYSLDQLAGNYTVTVYRGPFSVEWTFKTNLLKDGTWEGTFSGGIQASRAARGTWSLEGKLLTIVCEKEKAIGSEEWSGFYMVGKNWGRTLVDGEEIESFDKEKGMIVLKNGKVIKQ